jgi:antitoxin HicB
MAKKKTVEAYLKLPYTIEVVRDAYPDGAPGWVARVVELPGCMTQADSFDELGAMIQDALRAWIETALEDHQPIPEPRAPAEHSGRFVTRVPRSLHRDLVLAAEREGVSLNALVNVALARAVACAPAAHTPANGRNAPAGARKTRRAPTQAATAARR